MESKQNDYIAELKVIKEGIKGQDYTVNDAWSKAFQMYNTELNKNSSLKCLNCWHEVRQFINRKVRLLTEIENGKAS